MLHRLPSRVVQKNQAPIALGEYVLYWMVAARRAHHNAALARAVAWANHLKRPLVVFEPLRLAYPYASARLHRFVLDGMVDNARSFGRPGVYYFPYVERVAGEGAGLLEALAQSASVVVTDEFPCFFLPKMLNAVASRLPVRLEAVDGNGLLPLRLGERAWPSAATFRRTLHRFLLTGLSTEHVDWPMADPLGALESASPLSLEAVHARWPALEVQAELGALVSALPLDQSVSPIGQRGGARAGLQALSRFLEVGLPRYADERSEQSLDIASGLSPYLHFGQVSVHAVVEAVAGGQVRLNPAALGKREGFFGLERARESFLDELLTWRELGYGYCHFRPDDYDAYDSLPEWALSTLAVHADDPRPWCYEAPAFEAAATHDPLWNAAQRQLLEEGKIHNYLRMLWGKKILEWSPSPRQALATMTYLNNKYAVDGRDPNSYSGLFWTLGRFDRPFGPERPILGKIRYMSCENTYRKFELRGYLARFGGAR